MTSSRIASVQTLVSVVLPCLNEEKTVGQCIRKAKNSLSAMNLPHEVVIADNGSTDRSKEIAHTMGSRVVTCPKPGYGSAIRCGVMASQGSIIVMADADDSYALDGLEPFVQPLLSGTFDMVMGNRFVGGIMPGAMPWRNRYIGNPSLTLLLRLLFGGSVGDPHCGLRSFTKEAWVAMDPRQSGMEFASELVVRAIECNLRIKEVPTRLFPDGRQRKPHLRPWRDGLRHARYLVGHKWCATMGER